MSPKEFAIAIVTSGDLDPDYILMHNLLNAHEMDREQVAKWIFLKAVIYNSEQELSFLLGKIKNIDNLKKGAERNKTSELEIIRTWKNLENLSQKFGGWLIMAATIPKPVNLRLDWLRSIHGFGPWAAWKVMDLLDRVLSFPADLSGLDFRKAYTFPLKGMLLCAGEPESNLPRLLKDDAYYAQILRAGLLCLGEAKELYSRPRMDRKLSLLEFETVFCKYHSYVHKKYKVNQDLLKLRERFEKSEHVSEYREFCP